jgi:lysophospholipase L1-like esterase
VKGKIFFYTLSNNTIEISDKKGVSVFKKNAKKEKNTIFLSTGFMEKENSFFIIEEHFKNHRFSLKIAFKEKDRALVENASSPFYTPVIFSLNNITYLAYIDESFSIKVIDYKSTSLISKISFETPIHSLKYLKKENKIEFFNFTEGKYVKTYINVINLLSGKKIIEREKSYFDKKTLFYNKRDDFFKENFPEILSLDYKKFLGFGDSITFGYINRQEAPDKGYIPRLQRIIDSQWYGGEVINEGVPGEVTADAINRFEEVILKHYAKYLLFHEGTNDAIFPNKYSVSSILFNIKYMIKKAIDYNMVPVLTTIIPRNGKWGEGIYRERSIEISNGIKELSEEYKTELIDFFDIFLNYPDSDGGYMSLMSDTVHPSEKGYQLMAEKWFSSLTNIPPDVPTILSYKYSIDSISKTTAIIINLKDISDPDFKKFNIYFGEKSDSIKNYYKSSTEKIISIILPPGKYYIALKSEDNFGNESKMSLPLKYTSYHLFF